MEAAVTAGGSGSAGSGMNNAGGVECGVGNERDGSYGLISRYGWRVIKARMEETFNHRLNTYHDDASDSNREMASHSTAIKSPTVINQPSPAEPSDRFDSSQIDYLCLRPS